MFLIVHDSSVHVILSIKVLVHISSEHTLPFKKFRASKVFKNFFFFLFSRDALNRSKVTVFPAFNSFIIFFLCVPAQGLDHIAENILSFLDARSLCSAELVCKEWQRVISEGMLWKKLIERMVRTDPLWKGLSERHQW